jgi:hypothetical protein
MNDCLCGNRLMILLYRILQTEHLYLHNCTPHFLRLPIELFGPAHIELELKTARYPTVSLHHDQLSSGWSLKALASQ